MIGDLFISRLGAVVVMAGMLGAGTARCQTEAVAAEAQTATAPAQPADGTVLDRIVAVVNGDLVLESDVDEEQRFAAFQPISGPEATFSRPRAVERLINRDLILQQLKLQPQEPVTEKQVDDQLGQLRRDIPACKAAHCETDAGWQSFVAAQGFTMEQVEERWKQRMEELRFIEQRFRMGVRISPEEIKAYYEKTLLPQYAERHAKAPKLDAISERIQEVLLQEQVSSLLGDWLKSLRAQGTVRIVAADGASGQ